MIFILQLWWIFSSQTNRWIRIQLNTLDRTHPNPQHCLIPYVKHVILSFKQGWEFAHRVFWGNRSFFAKKWANEWFPPKNGRFAQKNERIAHSLIFGERPEGFAHSLIYHERPERIAHDRSFVMSDLSDSLTIAHLSWAILANRSQPLIWFERNE